MRAMYKALLVLFLFCLPLLIFMQKEKADQLNKENPQSSDQPTQPIPDPIDLPITSDPVISLSRLASLSPPVPPSATCVPPGPLPPPSSCEAGSNNGLTGKLLAQPRSIVMMTMFGFEVDTLEIALREQLDYLDMIFIIESTVNQKGKVKPLLWERMKYSDRFSFVNMSKVQHVVMDEGLLDPKMVKSDRWYQEFAQTDFGIERVKNWARTSGRLHNNDILISGDVDEILYPATLNLLRWCELSGPAISAGLWMPLGNLDKAYQSVFPVGPSTHQLPHTWRSPTIYKWEEIATGRQDGRRNFASWDVVSKYILGGIHMSGNSFLPTAILKHISGTDQNRQYHSFFDMYQNVTLAELDEQQSALYRWQYYQYGVVTFWITDADFDPVDKVTDIRPQVPWFLACNKKRYPYWFGEADPRNRNLLHALEKGSSQLSLEQRQEMFPYISKDIPEGWKKELMRLFFTPAHQDGTIVVGEKQRKVRK